MVGVGDSHLERLPTWLRFLDKTNITVISLTACANLYTRSSGILYFSIGAIGCTLTAKAIKRKLKLPRPEHSKQKKKSYGMPSTHSASMAYFFTYITLSSMYLPLHPSLSGHPYIKIYFPIIFFPYAYLVAASRIWLGHHSLIQVFAGCSYGALCAVAWFSLWTHGMNFYGSILERTLYPYIHL